LWEQRVSETPSSVVWSFGGTFGSREHSPLASYPTRDLPLAVAVAASSAYPPFFGPVSVSDEQGLFGIFADGGVIDNAALNFAIEGVLHLSERRNRYSDSLESVWGKWGYARLRPFTNVITHLLVADAGAVTRPYLRRWYWTMRILRRIVGIMFDRQRHDVMNSLLVIEELGGIHSSVLSLEAGYPVSYELDPDRFIGILARVRTHFDRFTDIEVACISYSGYCWADYWVKETFRERHAAASPARGFGDFLPGYNPKKHTQSELLRHLRASHLRFSLFRQIKRALSYLHPEFLRIKHLPSM
jgi:hypothetical protein